MIKAISAIVSALAATVMPAVAPKHIEKPPLAECAIVVVQEEAKAADANYVIEGSAQDRYNELKAQLDSRFEHMFKLKEELERAQNRLSAKWEEYYALNQKYNHELKKIISAWVTESNYSND